MRHRVSLSALLIGSALWICCAGLSAAPATVPGEQPAATGPSAAIAAPADSLDAEERALERQKQQIEKRLAEIRARRQGSPQTLPAEPAGPATSQPAEALAPAAPTQPAFTPENFSLHAQSTVITMGHDTFPSPYSGTNSLPPNEGVKTSETATLFLGMRLWQGGAIYFDPEIAGGEGFGGVTGIAGFPNGEIPRVATPEPEPYVARLYIRQDFGFGGEKEQVKGDVNQLAQYRDVSRFTIAGGKFSIVNFFDGNAFSHDPRSQFMNWSLMDTGSWDYPADTRGYTEGVFMELNQPTWTLRYALVTEPKTANGGTFDSHLNANGNTFEFEKRYSLFNQPGAARLMGYENNARMGNYREAIDHPGPNGPNVNLTHAWSVKYGFGISADQAITDDLGLFLRAGWNDGHTETWAFTEIDRTIALGLSLKGTRWGRPDDVVGLAGVINGLSKDHRDYLADGGYGFIIGDGRLHYAPEQIIEAYYFFKVSENLFVTPDFQFVDHPAYNRDRGPVVIGGVRAHIEF